MKHFTLIVLFIGALGFAQGKKSTGKIRFDDKAETAMKMFNDYTKGDFKLFESKLSDTVRVYVSNTNKLTKSDLMAGLNQDHTLFSDIAWGWLNTETASYKDGSVWTLGWGLWTGTGNFTKEKQRVPVHMAYQWNDDKIVTILHYFDMQTLNGEVKAMMKTKEEFPYEATYSSSWEIGSSEASKLVLDLQKAAEGNQFDPILNMVSDDIMINASDGSVLEGKEAFEAAYRSFFENYSISITPVVWIPVINPDGHEWVLLWTRETYTDKEGNSKNLRAQESFRIIDGKIAFVNQFQKPVKD